MPIMHGPGIRNPEEIQERDIPEADVQAYVAVGWKNGPKPKEDKASEAAEEPAEAPKPKKAKKGK